MILVGEVVDNEVELYKAGDTCKQKRSMLALKVAVTGEQGDELLLRQATCMETTVDTLVDLDHNLVLMPDDS